jgi:hypothetical protein
MLGILIKSSRGDKGDDRSPYALRISDCPVCHTACVVLRPWLAWASGRATYIKLSKLLNQENAWAHPS